MKLMSLKLFNFRQFWGEVELKLAYQGERCTTVIHGNNGAGKTTLLNAFTWVLYGETSAAFAPGPMVNSRAVAEAAAGKSVDCWVEVTFEHNGKLYQARRMRSQIKPKSSKSKPADAEIPETESALQLTINGKPQPEDEVDAAVGLVLPQSLHRYFFFDGERIERIVKSENKADMARAIKTLLSVEVLERSVRHLDDARRALERELRDIGDSETQRLLADKALLEEQRNQQVKRKEEIAVELDNQQELKERISAQLRDLASVGEIQGRRDDLDRQQNELTRQLERSEERLRRTISARGYVVFLDSAIAQFRNLADDLRQRGELPAGIKQQFVQDLLDDQRCICGAPLTPESEHRHQVETWLNRAGLQDVEESVLSLNGNVGTWERQVPEFWAEIEQEQASIDNLRRQIGATEDKLAAIREQLKGNEDVNVQGMEQRLENIELRIIDLHREDSRVDEAIQRLDGDILAANKQIKEHKAKDKEQARVKRQIAAAQDAVERLEEVTRRVDLAFRAKLEEKVREIWRSISFTSYLPKLTEDYELMLIDPAQAEGVPVAASTGQNQILSLAFIGSVIERVRYWSQKHSALGLDSGGFPVVMDSPFGSLDELNRRNIAQAITQLADQLVVLVSKTQWRGEVEAEMDGAIAAEYVLVYHTAKPDTELDDIHLHGRTYPLVKPSANEHTWTEVLRVDRE